MKISSIGITEFSASGLHTDCEGLRHIKSLPCLSVVQSVEGSYDIALDGGPVYSTGEGGAFIAPAEKMQFITHHNGSGGKMRARWVFLEATINGFYSLDDLFEFPVLLPEKYCAEAGALIDIIGSDAHICERYAAAYRLTGMLMEAGTPRSAPDETLMRIRGFVAERFTQRIGAREIAAAIHCSVSQVFRYTQKYFGATPSNYINSVRLRRAAALLDQTELRTGEIAAQVGFDDPSYFSRLFRRTFGMSPGSYRRFRRG